MMSKSIRLAIRSKLIDPDQNINASINKRQSFDYTGFSLVFAIIDVILVLIATYLFITTRKVSETSSTDFPNEETRFQVMHIMNFGIFIDSI